MNIGRLFLDVRGTITSKPNYDYIYETQRFNILIQKLIIKDNLDELRVSIVSNDNIESVEKYAKFLNQILYGIKKIHFGHHHADCKMMHLNGKIRNDKANKCDQMENNLRVCNHKICYYADDSKINRKIAQKRLSDEFPNMKLVLFDPKDKALQELNNAIEEYLKN